jgi:hypothetical protein
VEENMNSKKMVKLSNTIGFIAVLALIYWVIIFMTTQIFGLKIFKETLTQTFNWSIIGILVLMFGALIINIMFNLSRIADKINNDNEVIEKVSGKTGKGIIVFLMSLPIIIGTLFFGNYLSAKNIENELKESADEIISSYKAEIDKISDYTFDKNWINRVKDLLSFMVKLDPNFNDVAIIFEDKINGNTFYLTIFDGSEINEKTSLRKLDFIRNYKLKEREYIEKVFKENYNQKFFLSENGSYHLFVPYEGDMKIIFFFSNRKYYGTLSS